MRNAFIQTLLDCAKTNRNIELVTGDVGFGVLSPYWEACPDQFLNVGIAEQNMTAIAAGMALEGKIVFTYSIGNFPTLRCLEQIRNDCAYHNANVKILCVGGGFVYGALGMSHHATEDIAVMRSLPNMMVFAPADAMEAVAVANAILSTHGPCYVRLGRGGEPAVRESIANFAIGKALPVREGSRVAIFSTGDIYEEVAAAVDSLSGLGLEPTVYTFPTIKPLDTDTILRCAATHQLIVTVEEHNLSGGFGSSVAEIMASRGCKAKLLRIGIADMFCREVGDQHHLRCVCGIDSETIVRRIQEELA